MSSVCHAFCFPGKINSFLAVIFAEITPHATQRTRLTSTPNTPFHLCDVCLGAKDAASEFSGVDVMDDINIRESKKTNKNHLV